MKKLFIILTLLILIMACKKENIKEDKFLTSIKAGQTDGVGIKYVDFEPDKKLVYTYPTLASLKLDLNNDSIDDFELVYSRSARPCCLGIESSINPIGNNYICNQKSDTTNVEALVQGDIIDNNNTWRKSGTSLFYYWYSSFTSADGPLISEKISGSWYNHDNIYIGVKIIKDGKELFGWIDVNYQKSDPSDPNYDGWKEIVVRRFAISQPY